MNRLVFVLGFLSFSLGTAQVHPIEIVEKPMTNRIAFYALNESHTDYDVLFSVKGKNFRQSAAKPRLIRVPAASKVHLKTIVLFRDKKPIYTTTLQVNDSLSGRALKKDYEVIDVPLPKIKPKKQITVYTTTNCVVCDSIVAKLHAENYIFRNVILEEKPEVKKQLGTFLTKSPEEMDTISSPIISLGGRLYSWITSYEQLLDEVNKD